MEAKALLLKTRTSEQGVEQGSGYLPVGVGPEDHWSPRIPI